MQSKYLFHQLTIRVACLKYDIMKESEFLSFSKKERKGIVALVVILLFVIILPRALQKNTERTLVADVDKAVAHLAALSDSAEKRSRYYRHATAYPEAVPNSSLIQENSLRRRPEHRIYKTRSPDYSKAEKYRSPIDINTADTSAFIALPGIGSKLAARIVLFRDKLGGFVHVKQVSEVYGLRDSTYQLIRPQLKCNIDRIRKIDINSATKELLCAHPYIRWNIADVIVNYRSSHGAFSSVNDLTRLHVLDSVTISKLQPYLAFN